MEQISIPFSFFFFFNEDIHTDYTLDTVSFKDII